MNKVQHQRELSDSSCDEALPQVYLVFGELLDGHTVDGEHFIPIGVYRDEDAAERRVEAERVGGTWGRFDVDADTSDEGWQLSVETLDWFG